MKLLSNALGLVALWFAPIALVCADLRINEIMYRPASGQTKEQFIELRNDSPLAADLNGWRLSGAVDFRFTNVSISGRGFLVIVADRTTFSALHAGVTDITGNWSGVLDGRGTIRLRDTADNTVSSVSYDSEGDWSVRRLAPDRGQLGWEWIALHDGGGSSLELINPLLPHELGQNWNASTVTNGTPGIANSVAQLNSAPLIQNVTHRPIAPKPVDPVTVVARITDEPGASPATVTLYWRVNSNPPRAFQAQPMLDNGQAGDGAARDGSFGAILPAQLLGTIVEYYLTAADNTGNSRTYPRSMPEGTRTANLVYQVDTNEPTAKQPLYRVIMTSAEKAALDSANRLQPLSDANSSGAFIAQDGSALVIRQQVAFRNRGHGTRFRYPHNIKVSFPGDQPLNGRSGVNLNSAYPYSQMVGSAIMREIGLVMAESRLVKVHVNGINLATGVQYGSYAATWETDSDLIRSQAPLNSGGNIYRGIRNRDFGPGTANLVWYGDDYRAYTNAYYKSNHRIENDWTDLLDLIAVLNTTNGYAASNYITDIAGRLDVTQWMRYFASQTILDNKETNLSTGYGDDYSLYSGVADPRFILLPWDLDTIMGQGDTPGNVNDDLFRMAIPGVGNTLPAIDRLIKTPEFARIYYGQLRELCLGLMSDAATTLRLDRLFINSGVPVAVVDAMKAFNAARTAYIISQIPTNLSVTVNLPLNNGFRYTMSPLVRIEGRSDAVRTHQIMVAGIPATWSAWQARWVAEKVNLNPGLNRVPITALGEGGVELEQYVQEIWFDVGSMFTAPTVIDGNTRWTAENGPYQITANLAIAAGGTLSIEAGTSIFLENNARLIVANGGRILADGTPGRPIHFSRRPGGSFWGGISINGGPNSPETRLRHVHFEGNGAICLDVRDAMLWLDRATFGTTTRQYLSLDRASFRVTECAFPSATASFELVHGSGGIKAGGYGIVQRCVFGTTIGFNDAMDFTGGNRDLGQPIIQYYNNVFLGGSDDLLDLDGTDAWIEGNIFLHCHANGAPDSASAISGGNDGPRTSEVTVIGNLFYDCDQAATAKEGDFFTLLNNTVVRITKEGGRDSGSGVVNVQDFPVGGAPTAFGRGFYLEGNVITDVEQLVRNENPLQTSVVFYNNLLPLSRPGPGSGNIIATDPQLKHQPTLAETQFTNWSSAQILWDWFGLSPGSPARLAGVDGTDLGGIRPAGVQLTGVPINTVRENNARIQVGPNRRGDGIPSAGWPNGAGYTHYRWRLDNGPWSPETSIQSPITLSGLSPGLHQLEVSGRRDSGTYQDDPILGRDARTTLTALWTVDPTLPSTLPIQRLQLSEILADNDSILESSGAYPDLLELYNPNDTALDLTGVGLTTAVDDPFRFRFPPGSTIAGNGFLVLLANDVASAGSTQLPLGFKFDRAGESLFLFSAATNLIDSVRFGLQLPDRSIGRRADGGWSLNRPTFGQSNITVPVGDPFALRINEWLASHQNLAASDYIEIYNSDSRPVELSGLYLANAPASPAQSPLTPLSFIEAKGLAVYHADGDASKPNHVNFTLDPEAGFIGLSAADLTPIDRLIYGPQGEDIAEGRYPNGSGLITFLTSPSPGAPNFIVNPTNPPPASAVLNEIVADNRSQLEADGSNPDWLELYNPGESTADLGGLSVTDDLPAGRKFTFASGTLLGVRAFRRLLCDGARPASSTNTGFSLGRNGGAVYLIGPLADDGVVIDSIIYGLQARDLALGRFPDGAANWVPSVPTPGTTNEVSPLASTEGVRINEWLADNSAGDDWLELYNPAPAPVALTGFHLSDDPSAPLVYTFPPYSFLGAGPGAWVRLEASGDLHSPEAGHLNFKLKKAGDEIVFSRPAGGQIDAIAFGAQQTDISEGRVPDGLGSVVQFITLPSPGARNTPDADRDGMADDWENANGFSTENPSDAARDDDGDGLSNRSEYLAGTNPRDPTSGLRVAAERLKSGRVVVRFTVPAGHQYVLQGVDILGGAWQPLVDTGNAAVTRAVESVDDSAALGGQRFYRLLVRP